MKEIDLPRTLREPQNWPKGRPLPTKAYAAEVIRQGYEELVERLDLNRRQLPTTPYVSLNRESKS